MSDESFDRRRFLTGTSLAAGGALLAGCQQAEDPYELTKPAVPGASNWARGEERFVATSCAQCAAGCGVRVRVVEGRAVRIAGNPASPINEGGIGPRGISGTQVVYDPDRIRGPLKRVGGRPGDRSGSRLEPATWDEALAAIVSELARLRNAGEAQRVGVITGRERGLTREAWLRFARAYGTPNVFTSPSGGSAPLALACELMQGVPEQPAYDWAEAHYVVSFGSGLLDSCQSVAFARAQARLRQGQPGRRAKIVHVGPAAGRVGSNADEWIVIRAGTHGAFALGLAHVLVRDERHDARFVEEHSLGFEPWKDELGREHAGFRALLQQYTPEHAGEVCGVAPRVVERIARELAGARPSMAWCESDELLASNGLAAAMSVHALNALLGAIDRPGGLLVQRAAPLAEWKELELDEAATKSLAAERLVGARFATAPLDGLREALVAGRPYALAALLLDYSNPVYARGRAAAWRAALARIPLVVSTTPFLDETSAECADWILPDDTYLERFEDAAAAPSVGRAVFGLRQPVIERLHDTRSTGDVLLQLAAALEGPVQAALPWKEFKDAVKQRIAGLHTAQRGSIVEEKGSAFLKRFYEVGVWVDGPYVHERWEEVLRTPSGKFEFSSQHLRAEIEQLAQRAGQEPEVWLAASGLTPDLDRACMPHHEDALLEGEAAAYPLVLLPYRPSTYAQGSGANLPWLQELPAHTGRTTWGTDAELHPETAARLSVKSGERIRIESPTGAIECLAWVTSAVHPGIVRVPQGGGHAQLGRFARGIGANVMELVAARAPHPLAGFQSLCDTRVRVRRLT